ncbi:ABC transporter ATP-binding protein [Streptomyces sp. NPDC004610]|uniref:ABC transporter ATP-binding protein n=1 Tax=unclassified Streptomyces TaxID=2593676 RepID=UPI0033AD4109
MSETGALRRVFREGRPYLRARRRALVRLGGWSLLEAGQTFAGGYAIARSLDDGFLAADPATGLLWLGVAALALVPAFLATRGVFARLADLVEPLRDGLVRRAVRRAVGEGGTGGPATAARALAQVTQQSEIARDGWAGLVLAARGFVFTAAGALAGMAALAPSLLLAVLPPLLLGAALFLATLAPMGARQRACLDLDEEYAAHAGQTAGALRDIAAAGAAGPTAGRAADLTARQTRAAHALARWSAARVIALAVAERLPPLTLLAAAPWLTRTGVTTGELLGAFTYLTASLAPALNALLTAVGAAGGRLIVVLDRFTPPAPELASPPCSVPEAPSPPCSAPEPPPSCPAPEAPPVPCAVPELPLPPCPASELPPPSCPAPEAPSPPRPAPELPLPSCAAPELPPPPSPAPELPPPPRPAPGRSPALRAELRGVSFAYGPRARPVLDRLDLVLRPGDQLAVVGPSGSGKSTLAAVLAGVLAPTAGEVRWNDRPALALPHEAPTLRTLLPQQPYVFTGTLRDNLRYLRPTVPLADIAAAVTAIGLEAVVDRLGGLDTPFDPRRLSRGEGQLVALARAHVATAPLLILDEATSHLDPAAEARAEDALAARAGTLVVIAHRLTSARRAPRVLVVDGERTDLGTAGELLTRSPLFRELAGHWEGP